jgi:hypothetical protein
VVDQHRRGAMGDRHDHRNALAFRGAAQRL